MALTRRGRAVLVGGLGLGCVARLLGLVELYVLAAGAGGLVAAAAAFVLLRRVDLDVERSLHPARAHAGGSTQVHLRVANRAPGPSPLVAMTDPLSPGPGQARFLLPPLARGATDEADYRLGAERRGVFSIGPLAGEVIDPFGLARRTVPLAPVTEMLVYPAVERLHGRPDHGGGLTDADSPKTAVPSVAGTDFAGLRAYQVGDDLRRVHWPSTARTGELMIRQHEVARRGQVTVAVDLSAEAHSGPTFEAALSAAASVLDAESRAGSSVRLVTNAGHDSGFGSGPAHLDRAFEWLARIDGPGAGTRPKTGFGPAGRSRPARAGTSGTMVLIATTATQDWGLAAPVRNPASLTVVMLEARSSEASRPSEAGPRTSPPGSVPVARRTLTVDAGRPFGPQWDRALAPAPSAAGREQ